MRVVFPYFSLLDANIFIFDLKFGFYVKFPPQNRLEMSRIRNPGQKMTKINFYISLFLNHTMGLR